MKIRNLFFLLFFIGLAAVSCMSDDDICISGEATPRMKMKFKTKSTGKQKTLDSVFVKVDYGNGAVPVIANTSKTDSLLLPLRVDDADFTKIFIGTTRTQITSEITVRYTTKAEYVSPACGIKKVYENVNAELNVADAVLGLEMNQKNITDESKTHLFLLF